jgi:hypothetical protein
MTVAAFSPQSSVLKHSVHQFHSQPRRLRYMGFQYALKNPPVNDRDLRFLEAQYGSPLPPEVLDSLREADGGLPHRDRYYISEDHLPAMDQGISMEYLLSAKQIAETIQNLGEGWPKEVVPFGHDGNGNYICAGRFEGDYGIFFWDFLSGDLIGPIFDNIPALADALGKGPLSE